MSTASSCPVDFRLLFHDHSRPAMRLSKALLARADFDGTLQLLTSGWERALGYTREEFRGKTLRQLMGSDPRGAALAVAAILDRARSGPFELALRCRDGLSKRFRLHRLYDRREHVMYILADEIPGELAAAKHSTGTPREEGPVAADHLREIAHTHVSSTENTPATGTLKCSRLTTGVSVR